MTEGPSGGHISREDIARLVDHAASTKERRHLEDCDRCMNELSAMTAQTHALSGLVDIAPPAEDWAFIEARLPSVDRGLAANRARAAQGSAEAPPVARRWRGAPADVRTAWRRAAAGMVLFLAGGATGALLTSDGSSMGEPTPAPSGSTLVATSGAGVPPTSLSESEALVGMAESFYIDALLDYRARIAREDPALVARDPFGRLVMLENVLAATEAAVRESPADPFFNGLLASATAEHRAVVAGMASFAPPTW